MIVYLYYQSFNKKSRLPSDSTYDSDTTVRTDNDSLCESVTKNAKLLR